MKDLKKGFLNLGNTYKTAGGKFLKNMAVELFIETHHAELVNSFAESLSFIEPADVSKYVKGKEALPIPETLFTGLVGFEDWLEEFEPARLFEWIAEATPLIAAAIMDMGEEGSDYIVSLKAFIVDSVKAKASQAAEEIAEKVTEPPPALDDEEEETPPPPRFRATIVGEDTPPKPPKKVKKAKKKLTCDSCHETWEATEEEAAATTVCPHCGADA